MEPTVAHRTKKVFHSCFKRWLSRMSASNFFPVPVYFTITFGHLNQKLVWPILKLNVQPRNVTEHDETKRI